MKTTRRFQALLAGVLLIGSPLLVAQAAPTPELIPLVSLTAAQVDGIRAQIGLGAVLGPAKNGVELLKIRYVTSNGVGGQTMASGLLIRPTGATAQTPLVSYQHGTRVERSIVPSAGLSSPDAMVLVATFGGEGFVVSAADYLGLGDEPGIHPYLDAETEASSAADLVRAVRSDTGLGHGRLYLQGYSQGGHATMALHQLLELGGVFGGRTPLDPAKILPVTAAAPCAGPYDLIGTGLPGALANPPSTYSNVFFGYLLMGQQRVMPLYTKLDEVVTSTVAEALPRLFDGITTFATIATTLPSAPRDMLRPEVLKQLENRDPRHPLIQALARNSIYFWRAKAPVRLFHARGDKFVPFRNAEVARKAMVTLGSTVELVDVGASLDHDTAFMPSMIGSLRWFQALERGN